MDLKSSRAYGNNDVVLKHYRGWDKLNLLRLIV